MNSKDFDKFRSKFIEQTFDLSDKKRIEYCRGLQDEDVLTNFKSIGERLNIPPGKVLSIYLFKHIDSLTNHIKDGKEYSDEPIDSRISDIINYLLLYLCLVNEQK